MKYRVTISEINEPVSTSRELSASEASAACHGYSRPPCETVFEQQFADLNVPRVIAFLNRPQRKRRTATTKAS